MKFREDGTFHILQFADIQEIPDVSEDTLLLMNAALDKAKPDLVVLTGDQLKGASHRFSGNGERVEETIRRILKPVTDRKLPFAVTFGNHDPECGLQNDEQMEIYRSLPGCVDWLNSRGQEIHHGPREGTFAIGVKNSDETRTVMAVYLFDAGGKLPQGGYQPLPPGDIFWYKGVRDVFSEKNGGPVPGIVFQHIPLPEYYRLLKKVDRKTPGAVRAYRTHAGEYYVLDAGKCREGRFREAVSVPDSNNREFESFQEKGDIFAVYCGHDHKNSFVGTWQGIDLGYTPCCGFNEYGDGVERAAREFVFHEKDPAAYETRLLTYKELVGTRATKPLKDFFYRICPATKEEAAEKARRILLFTGLACVAGRAAFGVYRRRRKN
ncbi:MAG TPA: metallophosphoesterase family protein [Candidatus Eisenbergiella merdipullorum]|uniref:Metallophosphoesterase family protein n=1 Tax=Candidatus Eisenbergiella merdipullorum TaxID=2838553 RepID=A0A9D2I6Z5_9FIRM|nr:metallophosphoesterase family protein [Candidatus Eisenbergiella merdipullorum]